MAVQAINSSYTGEDSDPEQTNLGQSLAGKYMTFKLAAEEYGLPILQVREIIGLLDITRVPKAPDYIRGVINLRGKVIPVVDLRVSFRMEDAETTSQSVIIVVQYRFQGSDITSGILVDEVLEVRDIASDRIEPAPTFGTTSVDTEFVLGVGKAGERIIFLLDISRVLTTEQTMLVAQTASPEPKPGAVAIAGDDETTLSNDSATTPPTKEVLEQSHV